MSNKQFDLLVFIGRFQPYHNGHHLVVTKAMELAENVLVLVGSANSIRNSRNPFTFEERKAMIIHSLPEKYHSEKVMVAPINDHPYDEAKWIAEVQKEVNETANQFNCKKIGLIGHAKDHSSYYLKLFPNYESVDVASINVDGVMLNSTDIRKQFFINPPSALNYQIVKKLVPQGTKEILNFHNPEFKNIANELTYIDNYKRDWGAGPFVTVDAVVVQAGHILLVERADYPGKGQLALPGGFVEPRERLEDAVMRELSEETNIDVPPSVLKNRIVSMQHFSYPWRSNRAHIITFAFLFDLNSEIDRKKNENYISKWEFITKKQSIGMTKVKGGDDAANAMWYPLSELKSDMLFEDHFDICMKMLEKTSIEKL